MLLDKFNYDDQIRKDAMWHASENIKRITALLVEPEGKDHLKDRSVDGKRI
jgi:hypothetical protein